MLFSKKNKPNLNPTTPETTAEIIHKSKSMTPEFKKAVIKEKKQVLKDSLTREEVIDLLDHQIQTKRYTDNNPYKTREDIFITFYYNDGSIERRSVPFEEVRIAGKKYYINKKFEFGKIVIEEMYPEPNMEINVEDEWRNKESLKKQLNKINKYLLLIKDKIASGEEIYNLIDIEDMREEKIKLEETLESIKYGRSSTFTITDPINQRKHFLMQKINGQYIFLKLTDNGYVTPEPNAKAVVSKDIVDRVQEVVNKRNKINFGNIIMGIVGFIIFVTLTVGLYKLYTLDEAIIDKRIAEGIEIRVEGYKTEIEYYRNIITSKGIVLGNNGQQVPPYLQPD